MEEEEEEDPPPHFFLSAEQRGDEDDDDVLPEWKDDWKEELEKDHVFLAALQLTESTKVWRVQPTRCRRCGCLCVVKCHAYESESFAERISLKMLSAIGPPGLYFPLLTFDYRNPFVNKMMFVPGQAFRSSTWQELQNLLPQLFSVSTTPIFAPRCT